MATRSFKDIIDVFTRIPKNLSLKDTASWAGIGAGAGLLGALILSKKENRLRNALLASGVGALLGGYGKLLTHNVITEAGGHFREDPDYYAPEKMISDIKARGDNKDVQLYISGANNEPGGASPDKFAEDKKNGTYVFRWADGKQAAKAAKNLLDAGYNVHLTAHSAGGTGALDVLGAVDKNPKKLSSVNLLDAVDLDPLRNLTRKLGVVHGYKNKIVAHIPKFHITGIMDKFNEEGRHSNSYVFNNPFTLLDKIPGATVKYWDDAHSMLRTGLRRQWDKPNAYWLPRIKQLSTSLAETAVNALSNRELR